MNSKSRLISPPPHRPRSSLKPWLACLLLLAISFSLSAFITTVNKDFDYLALVIGISCGAILEIYLVIETIIIWVVIFTSFVLLLTEFLSTSWFEIIYLSTSVLIAIALATVAIQWLVKNWICSTWGKMRGAVVAAIVICLGIILQGLWISYSLF
ncbi:hypothetical protein [Myxosarcina sp. GI1]|uniref:hypothetical protein n=1 Tax=Myxosarcina sp. GI1 TaxID=1541065 RepID=UPI00055CA2AE|nr:hypothetical protein [Myxosarcina sp. GI1]